MHIFIKKNPKKLGIKTLNSEVEVYVFLSIIPIKKTFNKWLNAKLFINKLNIFYYYPIILQVRIQHIMIL